MLKYSNTVTKLICKLQDTSEQHSIFFQINDKYPIHIAIATSESLQKCKYKPDLKRLATVILSAIFPQRPRNKPCSSVGPPLIRYILQHVPVFFLWLVCPKKTKVTDLVKTNFLGVHIVSCLS